MNATPNSERNEKGQFAPGNSGGPGNPFARHMASLRQALAAKIQRKDVEEVLDVLKAKAMQGDNVAIRLYLGYSGNMPGRGPDPDTLDAHDIQTRRQNTVKQGDIQSIFEGMPAFMLCELAQAALPHMNKQRKHQFAAQLMKGLPPTKTENPSPPQESPSSDPHRHSSIGDCPGMQAKAPKDISLPPRNESQRVAKGVMPPSPNGNIPGSETEEKDEQKMREMMYAILRQRVKEARQSLGLPPLPERSSSQESDPHCHSCIGDSPLMQPSAPKDSAPTPRDERHTAYDNDMPPSPNGDFSGGPCLERAAHAAAALGREASGPSHSLDTLHPLTTLPGPTDKRGSSSESDPHCHSSIGDCPVNPTSAPKDSDSTPQNERHTASENVTPPSPNGDLDDDLEELTEEELQQMEVITVALKQVIALHQEQFLASLQPPPAS